MAWLGLIATGWLQSLNGSSYLFGSYSQALKLALALDQKSLDTLAFFNTLGSSSGIGPALLYDRIPPPAIVGLGIAHSSCGYFLIWLAIKNPSLFSLWHLSLFQLLVGFAQTYIQTAALVSGVRIFPGARGFVLGYLKGLVGLSASILVQFFLLVCHGREECMPLMLAWLLPLLSALPILAISRKIPAPFQAPSSISWKSMLLAASLIFLAAFLLAAVIVESVITLDRIQIVLVNLGMCLILLSPIYVLVKPDRKNEERESKIEGLLPRILESSEESSVIQEQGFAIHGQIGGEFTTLEAIATLDFWLLFLGVLLGTGSTSVVTSNLSQFGHSLGYSSRTITICVSLFSIGSCVGRLGSGILSEHALRVYATPRPVFLILTAAIQVASLLLGSIAVHGALFFVAILSGIADGAFWCLAIATASDLFGLASFSSILNIITFACPIGALLLSVLLVGSIYDAQNEQGLLCVGSRCFGSSFLAVAICCAIAGVGFAALARRNKGFYHGIHACSSSSSRAL